MSATKDLLLTRIADLDFETDAAALAEYTRIDGLRYRRRWKRWAEAGLTVQDICDAQSGSPA